MSPKKILNERLNLRVEKEVREWLDAEADRQAITDGSEMARKILREAMRACDNDDMKKKKGGK